MLVLRLVQIQIAVRLRLKLCPSHFDIVRWGWSRLLLMQLSQFRSLVGLTRIHWWWGLQILLNSCLLRNFSWGNRLCFYLSRILHPIRFVAYSCRKKLRIRILIENRKQQRALLNRKSIFNDSVLVILAKERPDNVLVFI